MYVIVVYDFNVWFAIQLSPLFSSSFSSLNFLNSENFTTIPGTEMRSSELDVPQKRLQIKEDDKFFSRLLSKESSMANPSSRIYYGGVSGAVPFTWESRPGTPKHTFMESSLPPLTPPPSYYSNSIDKKASKKLSRSGLLYSLFPRMNNNKHSNKHPRKPHELSSTSLSSSYSSWSPMRSTSVPGSLTPNLLGRRRSCSSSRSSCDSGADYEEEAIYPTSTLCFGGGSGLRGRCSVVVVKKAFLSMVGHGSGQGTA